MAEPALGLCADAGLSFEVTERSLVVPCANAPVDLLLVRPSDIPEYAQDGVVDLGITGANLVVEAEADVVTLAELGFARCSLEAAVPDDAPQQEIGDLDGLRVATAYPASTRSLLAERGVECELVPVSGSVEATPRLGLADAIVDLVSTGSTMSANGLRPIGRLLVSQAVLVGGRAAIDARRDLVDRLELMLSGVVAARRRRYVMMNAHVDDLPAIRALLPGMGAPSVLQLADEGEIAVHAAVDDGRDLGAAATPPRRRGDLDPRPPDREARVVRGVVRRRTRDGRADRRRRPSSRATPPLLDWTERLDGPRPEGLRVAPARIADARVDDEVLEALRQMIAAVRLLQRGAAAGRHDGRGGAGHRLGAPLASARRRRRLRPERADSASVVARDDRCARARRRCPAASRS